MYSEIKECMICGSNLAQVFDMGDQYVVDFPDKKDETLLRAPLVLMKCNACHHVQLKHAVSGERLYKKFWYRSGLNEQMKDELLAIVQNAATAVDLKPGDRVLDIGCNDGTLLGWYTKGVFTIGIDPCQSLVEEGLKANRLDIGISDFFSYDAVSSALKGTGTGVPKFKVITAVAMFYDVPNPIQFLKDCKQLLHQDGVIVVQMNYLVNMLNDTAFDFISHEHRALYSVTALRNVVERAGLYMQGLEMSDSNGGSLRAYITHAPESSLLAKHPDIKQSIYGNVAHCILLELKLGLHTQNLYNVFAGVVDTKMERLKQYLDSTTSDGNPVYVYGASTRGTALMQYLYRKGDCNLSGVAERDTNKYGKLMVGTWLKIIPEEEVRTKTKHMLVLPWHFRESIVKRESSWIRNGGSLIFPLPMPHVDKLEEQMPELVNKKVI